MAGTKDSAAPREVQGIWATKHLFKGIAKMTDKNILRTLNRETQNGERVEREKNRAGNPEGLSILDDIQSMKRELKELRESLQKETKEMKKELKKEIEENAQEHLKRIQELEAERSHIRACELEWINQTYDQTARHKRNEIIHGANISADLKALNYLKPISLKRFESACMGFKYRYGLLWADKTWIEQFPPDIIEAVNIRGNLNTLDRWKVGDAAYEAISIISLCDAIVTKWLNSQKGGNIYMYLSRKADCNDVRERYKHADTKF